MVSTKLTPFSKKRIDKLEKVHDNESETLISKTSRLNNPETYVLAHNRFITYMVLIFRDLNKAEI